jgi:predicted AlkP superfamily phosphohydrolase/phosphomutase
MERKRLVLLGLDGLDFEMVNSMLDELPNLKRMAGEGSFSPLRSVFPPDSIPSWITAYTGLDPSEHGILESVDYLAKGDDRLKVDTSTFRGKSFWDVAGNAGRKVCVVNPFMAYPVWPVSGVMVNGPVFIGGEIQVSDPAALAGIPVPLSLGGITDFPTRNTLGEFVAKTVQDTREQAVFGLALLQQTKPDLFFQTFLTTDRIQHFLWRYCDPSDPTWPGDNPHSGAIRDFYIEVDRIVGTFLEALDPDQRLMLISDHGHGMRCTHCFNINEYLRREGLVVSQAQGKRFSKKMLIEMLKNRFLKFMNDHDLEDYISVVAKFVPNAKAMKKGKHISDSSKNMAYASDFTGTNPFGGICINANLVDDPEALGRSLMEKLGGLKFEGEPVFQWIKPRKELFSGPYLEKFPDLLFEMNEALGVNWGLHTDLFTVNPTHKKISGGHRRDGIFFFSGAGEVAPGLAMTDLYPSILGFLDVPLPEPRLGRNALQHEDKHPLRCNE